LGESKLSGIQLEEMWKVFETIYFGARDCYRFHEDEKAWTLAVVQKLLDCGAVPANKGI